MIRLLRADFYRMYHGKMFWSCLFGMIGVAAMFIVMQYTAMDYVVELDRVIFLPISFYGLFSAALISYFIGEDFQDGTIRNKIVAGHLRKNVYLSSLLCSWMAGLMIYAVTIVFTVIVGIRFFENNVPIESFLKFFSMGLLTCLAMGSIYGMIPLLLGDRTKAIMACMALAFFMLFLCMYTNNVVAQEPYKNGVENLRYIGGLKRKIYEFIHDLNPFGQAAQLSSMECLCLVRWIGLDIFWMLLAGGVGNVLFQKRDIR